MCCCNGGDIAKAAAECGPRGLPRFLRRILKALHLAR